jgi:hypothetical protein
MVGKRGLRHVDAKISASPLLSTRELANDVQPDIVGEGIEHRGKLQFVSPRFFWQMDPDLAASYITYIILAHVH